MNKQQMEYQRKERRKMGKFYRIEPIYEERIWGGQEIRRKFGYETELKNIAEAYHVIAIPGHLDNRVAEADMPLSEFYRRNRELFDCGAEELPVRLVTACADGKLSVHLHPTDEYGLAHEGMRGKVEGGFALTESDQEVEYMIGHHAQTLEEFKEMVENQEWDRLLRRVKGKLSDYSHMPIGTLHGESGDGSLIMVAYSTNGDVTYRLWDHGRIDPKRPLNVQAVYDNVTIPDDTIAPYHVEPYEKDGCMVYDYYSAPGEYTGRRIKTIPGAVFSMDEFMFLLCLDGETDVNGYHMKPGETLFVPAHAEKLTFGGTADICVLSYTD